MRPSDCVGCKDFPCRDVDKGCYLVPDAEIRPERVKIVMISECAPADASDYFYAGGESLFAETTLRAFSDANVSASSVDELLQLGVYLTTAIKCGKVGYGVKAESVKHCSIILEKEIELFPQIRAFLLMGDLAIKSLNHIARRQTGKRVIPAGSTYRIRGGDFTYRQAPVFPSYLQAGKAFYVEKSKRRMIAEDIRAAMQLL